MLFGTGNKPAGKPASRPAGKPPRVITTRPQVAIGDGELRARVQWGSRTSAHFALTFDRISFSDKQSESLLATLEAAYSQIFHFTHESFADRCHVYAIDQRLDVLMGCAVRPHFNAEEQAIYLVETSRHHADCDVARLVTHAMRGARYGRHYRQTPGWPALEEGFSIFLTERMALGADAFPLYGAAPDVVAHHLVQARRLQLAPVWSAARDFTAHELTLLGAFFLYLGDTFSDDRVVAFSKSEDAISEETFRRAFGESLDELEYAWTQRLPVSLVAHTLAEQEAMLQKWEQANEGHWHC
jgi:hypothetical protein